MEQNPLVSICIPVYNGGDLLHMPLESALCQTYKNFEVVVVDNASVDNTHDVVLRYAARDPRIKYFRNETNIGPNDNFLKSFRLANGQYIQLLSHDDWLSKNYLSEGIKNFNTYPRTAAVFAKSIGLVVKQDGKLSFKQMTKLKPGNYSKDFFLRRMYRDQVSAISIYSLLRKKDMISALEFTLNIFYHPSPLLSEDFQRFHKTGFGIDIVLFLKILTQYDFFTFAADSAYMTLGHPHNTGKQYSGHMNDALGVVRNYDYFRICHEYMYATVYKKYLLGFRASVGADVLNTIFFNFIKSGFSHDFFKNFSLKDISYLFRDFTSFQMATALLYTPVLFCKRILYYVKRRIFPQRIPWGKNFLLDKDLHFISHIP